MATSTQSTIEAEPTIDTKRDPTELSIGKIVAYLVGGFSILAGVAALFTAPIMGIFFIAAGVFGLPPTRGMIEDELNVRLSRWLAVMLYLVILFVGSGLSAA